MSIRILFVFLLLTENYTSAKRVPFRLFYYPPQYEQYKFDDWEVIKKHLSTTVLRGNNIDEIKTKSNHVNRILARLATMELQESEKKIVRAYLLSFLYDYLYDARFEQLLSSIEKPKRKISHGELVFYDKILFMPSNILCVVAALSPEEEDIDKAGKLLMTYYQRHPYSEKYLMSFLSDLHSFKRVLKSKTFLENSDFSVLSEKTRKRIDMFHMDCLANMTKTQRETWDFLLQQHLICLHKANNDKIESNILDNNDVFSDIFLTMYPRPDYNLVIERAKADNVQYEYFFMLQLYFLIIHQKTNEPLSQTEKKLIERTMKQFIDNNKAPDTLEKKQICDYLVKNSDFMLNRLKIIMENK